MLKEKCIASQWWKKKKHNPFLKKKGHILRSPSETNKAHVRGLQKKYN